MVAVMLDLVLDGPGEADLASRWMHAHPLPGLVRQRADDGDRLRPEGLKLLEDQCWVVLVVAKLRRQLVRFNSMELWPVVVREFSVPFDRELLHVPEMARQLQHGPLLRRGLPPEHVIRDAAEERRQGLRCLLELRQKFLLLLDILDLREVRLVVPERLPL